MRVKGGIDMQEYMKKYAKNSLAISILLIILALFLIFKPMQSLNFIMILLGIILTLNGIIHSISYFSTPNEYKMLSFELVQGVICVVLGLVFIFNPSLINSFLTYIIGAWILIESVIKIQMALNLKSMQNSNWMITMLLGLLTLALAIVIIINPFATIAAVTTVTGIILLASEIMTILETMFIFKI